MRQTPDVPWGTRAESSSQRNSGDTVAFPQPPNSSSLEPSSSGAWKTYSLQVCLFPCALNVLWSIIIHFHKGQLAGAQPDKRNGVTWISSGQPPHLGLPRPQQREQNFTLCEKTMMERSCELWYLRLILHDTDTNDCFFPIMKNNEISPSLYSCSLVKGSCQFKTFGAKKK